MCRLWPRLDGGTHERARCDRGFEKRTPKGARLTPSQRIEMRIRSAAEPPRLLANPRQSHGVADLSRRSFYRAPLVARTPWLSALVNARPSAVVVTGIVPNTMAFALALAPYIASLALVSGFRLPPERSIPANSPFERE